MFGIFDSEQYIPPLLAYGICIFSSMLHKKIDFYVHKGIELLHKNY